MRGEVSFFFKLLSTIDAMVTLSRRNSCPQANFVFDGEGGRRESCGTLAEAQATARVHVPTALHQPLECKIHEFSTCQRHGR